MTFKHYMYDFCFYSMVAQMVNHLNAMQKIRVQSLGKEDTLEKETATHSSILAWRISWTEEPGWLQSMDSQRVWHNWASSPVQVMSEYYSNNFS